MLELFNLRKVPNLGVYSSGFDNHRDRDPVSLYLGISGISWGLLLTCGIFWHLKLFWIMFEDSHHPE